LEFEN